MLGTGEVPEILEAIVPRTEGRGPRSENACEPRTEDGPTMPTTPYGASKLAAEELFRQWASGGANRRALIIRPCVVFGPRNFAPQRESLMFTRLLMGRPILIPGDGMPGDADHTDEGGILFCGDDELPAR